jgi:alpha-L-fucosidase 2
MERTMKVNRRKFIAGAGAAGLATSSLRALGERLSAREREATPSDLCLSFDRPARQWTEALPHGNGRLGAMVFGGVEKERIQLNEDTLWTGGPHNYVNSGAREHLEEMRKYIFSEKVKEADALSAKMLGTPAELQAYQPLCDLFLGFPEHTSPIAYHRQLDLANAISLISYQQGGVRYSREVFSSYPDHVVVVHLSADHAGRQDFQISLSCIHESAKVELDGEDGLLLSGQMGSTKGPDGSYIAGWDGGGLRFAARIRVLVDGGRVNGSGDTLTISGANEATVIFSAATSYVSYRDITGDPFAVTREVLGTASSRSIKALRTRHVEDYQELFNRVSITLGTGKKNPLPTDERIQRFTNADDPSFAALFYQFGRYMLIASSRAGGQAANLQGMWNQERWPNWGAKWTSNINVEMNYWPAESGNLAECTGPLFDLIDGLRVTGAEVARSEYGCRGFVFHHNADLWRATAPTDGSWGMWPVGGAWLTHHLWEHYEFSRDEEFLRQRAYPAIKDATAFMLDFLVEIPAGLPFAGCLATNPSSSPENAFILPNGVKGRLTYAPSMDIEIIGELFDNCVYAAEVLGVDQEFVTDVKHARQRLPPLQVNKEGRLQEWIKDYTETEPEHRHLSHLYAVYPGSSITQAKTPDLQLAAKNSLVRRGINNGPQCCFKAWRMALWARLGDGNQAYKLLQALISTATSPNMLSDSFLQVDGHLGGPAAIAEMLLQSHTGEIVLLPALPDEWAVGSVRGLRARGGAVLEFQWRDGELTQAVIHASQPGQLKIKYRKKMRILNVVSHATYRLNRDLDVE